MILLKHVRIWKRLPEPRLITVHSIWYYLILEHHLFFPPLLPHFFSPPLLGDVIPPQTLGIRHFWLQDPNSLKTSLNFRHKSPKLPSLRQNAFCFLVLIYHRNHIFKCWKEKHIHPQSHPLTRELRVLSPCCFASRPHVRICKLNPNEYMISIPLPLNILSRRFVLCCHSLHIHHCLTDAHCSWS